MRAFPADDFDANPLRRDGAVKRFLVNRKETFDPFRRGRLRVVVDLLWGAEFIADRLQFVAGLGGRDHFRNRFRAREQES